MSQDKSRIPKALVTSIVCRIFHSRLTTSDNLRSSILDIVRPFSEERSHRIQHRTILLWRAGLLPVSPFRLPHCCQILRDPLDLGYTLVHHDHLPSSHGPRAAPLPPEQVELPAGRCCHGGPRLPRLAGTFLPSRRYVWAAFLDLVMLTELFCSRPFPCRTSLLPEDALVQW